MNEDVTTVEIGRLLLLFTDPDRLRVLTAMLDDALMPAEIAASARLDMAGTMRHLKTLQQARLVEMVPGHETRFRATLENLKQTTIALAAPSRVPQNASVAEVDFDTRQVLSAFFDGGRLKALPMRNRRKKMVVLEELLRRIPWKSEYREAELDQHIKPIYEDYCSIRRAWIDFLYMVRDHGVYTWTRQGMNAIKSASH
ncbi:DUF2087 domain-containing protein [Mesorhizobium sp. CO1-1-8]|uniref:DUF2087 domain-containing protein n=1 Tax=Mesorhizobium sp. CO1-1-8 TaxID=2876631 RepID=UPI001CD1055B|nr:DUF2087 domain-containing protein [Mesorhizobium sp. CO1-1-8]MBZ9771001.1 DUF2087 domain-containing protein [Mesorhizobium sp. CO1-1-8]